MTDEDQPLVVGHGVVAESVFLDEVEKKAYDKERKKRRKKPFGFTIPEE